MTVSYKERRKRRKKSEPEPFGRVALVMPRRLIEDSKRLGSYRRSAYLVSLYEHQRQRFYAAVACLEHNNVRLADFHAYMDDNSHDLRRSSVSHTEMDLREAYQILAFEVGEGNAEAIPLITERLLSAARRKPKNQENES